MQGNIEFEYKVSVIVPIYNVENHLERCLESLVSQTIDSNLVEVLLIDDGSTDNSLNICKQYSQIYPTFKVFSKENEGVSATRNMGIVLAKGKYIMFLDSDDAFSPETIENVTNFFDEIYEEVDVVTFNRVMYQKNKLPKLIDRYANLKEQKVYDLEEYYYFTQNTLNIATKNNKNVLFDTSMFQGEDQKYVIELITPKMKIGYCNQAEYKYIRHESSAVATQSYSFYLFEQRMRLWGEFIEKYGELPKYIQSIILDNWSWELLADCIFPYHYKGEKREKAKEEIRNIVSHIDTEIILNHPKIDLFHKHFWLSLKNNINTALIVDKKSYAILLDGKKIYERSNMEIILHQISVINNKISVLGFIKSPIFNYIKEKPILYAVINEKTIAVNLFDSIHSYYKTTAHTNYFWGFRFITDIKGIDNLSFITEVDGIKYQSSYYCMPSSVFNKTLGIDSYVRNNYLIKFDFKHKFFFSAITDEETMKLELSRKFNENCESKIYKLRKNVVTQYSNNKKVWLYNDCNTSSLDNAYYQFQHDFNKDDGIERYYVFFGKLSEIKDSFTEAQQKYLLKYGTDMHKYFYLKAEYIISSFSDKKPRIPFATDKEHSYYRDLRQPITIYLQHGVCHADLRYLQSAERCKVDKIVVSSTFEKINFVENYHYCEEDIIPTGMARYDYLNKDSIAKNRIIFAPSWRSYLMNKDENANSYNYDNNILKSDYFLNIKAFLNNKNLIYSLEENDLYLDVKLHPHMKSISKLLCINSDRIMITTDAVKLEDYKLFITDFSSFAFDYAYLNRPILYFVPDMLQFESGMNHYRKLDLPFEKAFGNLTTEPEEAVKEIINIIERGYTPEEKFRIRMDEFFLPMNNCTEQLYKYLTN